MSGGSSNTLDLSAYSVAPSPTILCTLSVARFICIHGHNLYGCLLSHIRWPKMPNTKLQHRFHRKSVLLIFCLIWDRLCIYKHIKCRSWAHYSCICYVWQCNDLYHGRFVYGYTKWTKFVTEPTYDTVNISCFGHLSFLVTNILINMNWRSVMLFSVTMFSFYSLHSLIFDRSVSFFQCM